MFRSLLFLASLTLVACIESSNPSLDSPASTDPAQEVPHTRALMRPRIDPSGQWIAYLSYDRTERQLRLDIKDTKTGQVAHTLQDRIPEATDIAWSPDGLRIAVNGSRGELQTIEIVSRAGEEVATLHLPRLDRTGGLAWLDERHLLAGGINELVTLNSITGEISQRTDLTEFGLESEPESLAVLENGVVALSAVDESREHGFRIWRVNLWDPKDDPRPLSRGPGDFVPRPVGDDGVVFARITESETDLSHIWFVDLASEAETQLTSGAVYDLRPAWVQSQKKIVFWRLHSSDFAESAESAATLKDTVTEILEAFVRLEQNGEMYSLHFDPQ